MYIDAGESGKTTDRPAFQRMMAAARPDAYLGDLARSLNNWGTMLSAVGRAEGALEAARALV